MTIDDPVILLVEDSEEDALLMHTVAERAGFGRSLTLARNGEEAIAYLRGDGAYRDRRQFPLPAAVLLDLNLPRINGFEVLSWMRQQPAFKHLHTYILTSSSRPEDIQKAYDLGANSYLVKPVNFDGLVNLTNCLLAWLRLSHFTAPVGSGEDHGFTMLSGNGARLESTG